MTQENISPKWFFTVSIIALIWNLMGLMAFVAHMLMTPEAISQLPAAQQALYKDIPLWATIAFALAVICGSLGCLALTLKKTIAKILLIISLVAVFVQNFHSFVINDSMTVMGTTSIIMPLVVIMIGIALIALSNKAINENWLS